MCSLSLMHKHFWIWSGSFLTMTRWKVCDYVNDSVLDQGLSQQKLKQDESHHKDSIGCEDGQCNRGCDL